MLNFKTFLIRSAQFLLKNICLAFFKIAITGKDNLPSDSQALVVANHSSYLDIPVVGCALYEKLLSTRWVISKFNYRLWYLKWVYLIFKVIVVNGTVEKIRKDLKKNRWVVIFPEGGAKWCSPKKNKKQKARNGAAVIALTSGVLLIPIGIRGADKVLPTKSFRLSPKHQINVRIGKPFSFPPLQQEKIDQGLLEKTTSEIMNKISNLM